ECLVIGRWLAGSSRQISWLLWSVRRMIWRFLVSAGRRFLLPRWAVAGGEKVAGEYRLVPLRCPRTGHLVCFPVRALPQSPAVSVLEISKLGRTGECLVIGRWLAGSSGRISWLLSSRSRPSACCLVIACQNVLLPL